MSVNPATVAPTRADRVTAARAAWTRHLVDLGGRNTLLWYRDLPTGTLDLTTAHPAGLARLLAGQPTTLSDLLREPGALDEGRRRARAIAAKTRELREERGILTGFLAVGMATWTARTARGATPRPPAAPVLLRTCTLRAIGVGARDYRLELGDEVELNPVLVHYLRSEQGIEVDADAIEALADGVPGVAPDAAFAALAQACDGIPDFEIAGRLVVGNFSYAKLPMVADLALQADTLADHPVVAALAGDPGALAEVRAVQPPEVAEDVADRDRIVLDADSSQYAVIEAARAGSHLVVHGPPGTGKSQTIANLIASLAADGRRVLFVAEKRAAIDAVIGRLEKVGLGDLVLDLHDGGRGRRRVAAELVEALDALEAAPSVSSPARGELAAAEHLLGEHLDALHGIREPWEVSLYAVNEELQRLRSLDPAPQTTVRFSGQVLAGLTRDRVGELGRDLATVASLGGWSGGAADDPWFGADVRTPEDAARAREVVVGLPQALQRLETTVREVFRGIELPPTATVREAGETLASVVAVRDTLEVFRPEIFDYPLGELVAATASREERERSGYAHLGWWTRRSLRRQARSFLRPGPPPADLHAALVDAQAQRTVWGDLAGPGGRPEIPGGLDQAVAAQATVAADLAWLDERLPPEARRSGHLLDAQRDDLYDRVGRLGARVDRLAVVPTVHGPLARAADAGLGALVLDLATRQVAAEDVTAELDLAWYGSLRDEISVWDARVGGHDGDSLRRTAATFAQADHAVLAENATLVRAAVRDRVARVVASRPEAESQLRAEGAKVRRRTPLRDLVPEIGDLLTAVRPCWVMSPLVVASVLPAGRWFDVVVFDEASQIPPAEAVSAISRAGQVVVAGDSRQLPPTSFFATVTEGEDLSDGGPSALTEGVESVLDVLAAALPARRLSWHYRSLDERLVAFANEHVYGGSLVTFPGTGTEPVVRLVAVDGVGPIDEAAGAVESTRAEVEAVVDLVIDHARTRAQESLGVIALGIKHASRIEDSLRRRVAELPEEVAAFFADDRPEPFFVKNLERVQGDERDVVMLSIGYGKTAHGRVLHRFGPLNIEGGERRLNVATTRARRRMVVIASFTADDLDPTRLKATGALLLRDFLAYAASGGPPAGVGSSRGGERSLLVADLARRLRAAGITVHEDVGASQDPVDLAVEDPARPGHLLLAVESDGPTYAAMPTSRERDRLRAEHLARLGWTPLRVFHSDLLVDPEREVSRILRALGREPS